MKISQKRLMLTWAFMMIVALLGSVPAIGQSPLESPLIKKKGFIETLERTDIKDILVLSNKLDSLPAKASVDIPFTGEAFLTLLNRRLFENKFDIQVVLESSRHPLDAKTRYLDAKCKSIFSHELSVEERAKAVSTMTCGDLLVVVKENTKLNSFYRRGYIVLCDYIAAE